MWIQLVTVDWFFKTLLCAIGILQQTLANGRVAVSVGNDRVKLFIFTTVTQGEDVRSLSSENLSKSTRETNCK